MILRGLMMLPVMVLVMALAVVIAGCSFTLRRFKMLSYSFDFFRLNRRMHNKSFTVDGRACVLGGRNVGDEYFSTGQTPLFVDLDVFVVGDIIPAISEDFDRYWNSPSAYPARQIVTDESEGDPVAGGCWKS